MKSSTEQKGQFTKRAQNSYMRTDLYDSFRIQAAKTEGSQGKEEGDKITAVLNTSARFLQ